MRTLITLLVLMAVAYPAYAVPLAEWVADEAKLLGEEPVTLADLPDEWQGLSNADLQEIAFEVEATSREYYKISEYAKAVVEYEKQVYLFRVLGYLKLANNGLSFLGSSLMYQAQYDQALVYYYKSLDIYCDIGDREGERRVLHDLGFTYMHIGQYSEALEHCQKSLAICREINDKQGQGFALNTIGSIYWYQGKYEQALEYAEQSLSIRRQVGDIRDIGSTLNDIAIIYQNLGQYENALEYYLQALDIFREIGEQRPEAITLNNIAGSHLVLGNLEKAGDYYLQSYDLCYELGILDIACSIISNIGLMYENEDLFSDALENYEIALAIRREIGDIQGEGDSLASMAWIYGYLGQYQEALTYYEQSLAIMREIGDIVGEGSNLSYMGLVYEEQGKFDEALMYYSAAYEIAFNQALQFSWETGLKGGLVAELSEDAAWLATIQLELNQLDEAFLTLQSSKGVPLLQLLAQAKVQSDDPLVQEALSSYRTANATVQAYREQLRVVEEDDAGQRTSIHQRIDEEKLKAIESWDYLQENAPEITDIISVKGLTVEEVQEAVLHEGQVVLEYLVTEDDIVIFCLPKAGELTVAYAEMPDLGETEFSDWLGRRIELLYANEHQISDQAAKALYQLLIEPVEEYIPAGSELIICPDRELFIVPFEALMDEGLLLDKHSITYSTSATMLSYIKPPGGTEGALIAGVSFGAGEENNSELLEDRGADLVRGRIFAKNLPALPGVIDETNEIAAIYGIEPVLDAQVTEAFLRQSMPGKKVIHLATHGYLSDIPLLNGVVTFLPGTGESSLSRAVPMLPGGDEELSRDVPLLPGSDDELRGADFTVNTNDDGFLTMAEVMGIPLAGCELVTLSACHSAEGEVAPGEGVMGLSQGFMYAGARSILASLTKVDDSATKLLMVEFYTNWNGGMTKREALRAAKQTMIEVGYAAPKYWAPFVLYGVE